jgi:hypothetical protein
LCFFFRTLPTTNAWSVGVVLLDRAGINVAVDTVTARGESEVPAAPEAKMLAGEEGMSLWSGFTDAVRAKSPQFSKLSRKLGWGLSIDVP